MSQKPPDGLICDQCCYKQAAEKRQDGILDALTRPTPAPTGSVATALVAMEHGDFDVPKGDAVGEIADEIEVVLRSLESNGLVDTEYYLRKWARRLRALPTAPTGSGEVATELMEAVKQMLYLHCCEQEGMSSGMPTFEQWMEGYNRLEAAYDRALAPLPDGEASDE